MTFSSLHDCVRCNQAPAVTEDGYCSTCHWLVRVEVEDGFMRLQAYLRKWAGFAAWERTHG